MKKHVSYLIIGIIGIVLIFIGIFLLAEAMKQNDNRKIFIRALILFFWALFTAGNFYLYKKEIRKNKEK